MKKLNILIIVLFSYAPLTFAQIFIGEASLPRIENDGFYRIELRPEITTHLNPRFTNIRIYDGLQEVPYVFESELSSESSVSFREYQIVEKSEVDSFTSLILRNPARTPINNISLLIKNADVSKVATLSGSDDRKNWYALKESFIVSNINGSDQTSEIRIVDFPLSNYEYYAIRIDNRRSNPLNFLKAGYYETIQGKGQYWQVPSVKFIQSDSSEQRKTYVRVTFDTLRFVDKITWTINGGPYYLRNAAIYEQRTRTNKKGKKERYLEYLSPIIFKSSAPEEINLPGIKVNELLLVIENEDNPPIKIQNIEAFQLRRYLTAWLKKENQYVIRIGPEDLREPVYDLPFFREDIPSVVPFLDAGIVSINSERKPVVSSGFFTNRAIIWSAIILVIILLGFMSVKLIRETNAVSKSN
jgi:hypothetical protein